jgi:hypothetical protein
MGRFRTFHGNPFHGDGGIRTGIILHVPEHFQPVRYALSSMR